jgi:hypothetical protein
MDTSTKQSIRARSVVNNGLRDGKIEKPENCEGCGKPSGKLQAHHPKGDKHPEVVKWLCLDCHGGAHEGREKRLSDSPLNRVRAGFRKAAKKAFAKGEHETGTM